MTKLADFIVFVAFATGCFCVTCPSPWNIQHLNSCYMILHTKATFDESERACESHGGHLAIINNADEQNYLTNYLKHQTQLSHTHFWIDGTDREVQGNWFWEWTGEQIAPMYTNWHTAGNEPNNLGGNEHCLEYGPVYGYQWNDIPCSHHFSAICEKD